MATLRAVEPADLSYLANLWQEHMTLIAHDRRFALSSDARERWIAGWTLRLGQEQYTMFGAEDNGYLVGYGAGQIQSAPLGLPFQHVGIILEMAVDTHKYHHGVGRLLAEALKQWFHERDILQVVAAVPHGAVIDQAFWRSLGAAEWMHYLWIK